MKIRKYQDPDRKLLIKLWKEAFPDDPPHNEPSGVLSAKLAVDDLVFVAVDGERMVGGCIAGYDGHRGWLYSVAVAEDHRRQGVGEALVGYAEAALAELGCIKVNLQIRSTNTQVIDFYRSLGFVVEERVSMGKRLDGPGNP